VAEIFRIVHTIKGTCGFLGLPRLEKLAHAAENVLGRYRDGSLAVTSDGISLILEAMDGIKAIVSALAASGQEPAGNDAGLIARLDAVFAGHDPATGLAAIGLQRPTEAAKDTPAPTAAVPPAPAGRAAPAPASEATSPPSPDAIAAPAPLPAAPMPTAAAREEAPAEEPPPAPGVPQTIRVSVDVLEDLMRLVSELVLTRNQLLQLARGQENPAFSVPLQRLSHITSDLQEGVMKTRMQPIGNAWGKLPRLVRDLARDLGKRIELEMTGADTELDRQVLELIKDPLTHMVRNSADHGLEMPEARRAAGKPETGRIRLDACHEGGHIVISLSDDGRGLPVEKIRAKAVAQGLLSEAEAAALPEREALRLIFRPGFSTAEKVTAVSGRGVGMDVVKTNIEKIGGTIEVASSPGRGASFIIRIPLTLAIVSALIVSAGGERFAIPQIGVQELVRVGGGGEGARIERIKDTPVLRLRDRLLPLVSLARLLRLAEAAEERAENFVVVTQAAGRMFGLVVDRVFDTEEIVVKPVAPILRDITVFSGNTILGDGSVIMILDAGGIARAANVGAEGGAAEEANAQGKRASRAEEKTSLLLFRAVDETPKAVPLALVARIETFAAEQIERSGDTLLVQYRGALMPLVPMSGFWQRPEDPKARQQVLVFADGAAVTGLLVDEILDVVEEATTIAHADRRPGFLGSAVIQGRVTDMIDTAHWLTQARGDWFRPSSSRGTSDRSSRRLLLIDDSPFFRSMVAPVLAAANFSVVVAEDAGRAFELQEAGEMFDVIVSDIEMPGLNGLDFVRKVRSGGSWAELPIIALSARASPEDVEEGRRAGFTDYVAKFDRSSLLRSIEDCLSLRGLTEAASPLPLAAE
jgi:two-component system chemotaxis sensor kinase CheA